MPRPIPLLTNEASLKRAIRRHLASIGFKTNDGFLKPEDLDKPRIRQLHEYQRSEKLVGSKRLLASWSEFERFFASGGEIFPDRIQPRLEIIAGDTWQSDLFAMASLYWSVPTSHGYGRRLRFICWDDSTGKVMGLLALGDPVFNLSVRDNFVGWEGADRKLRLSCVMDAYVLGAIPPYNMILGGKLLACLLRSHDISDAFHQKYSNYRSIISGKKLRPKLALITTSSSLGRSSVYNRLKIGPEEYLRAVGYTRGFGHFHIPDRLFDQMRAYLAEKKHAYADGYGFGQGSNWRMRVIRESLTQLGMSPNLLRHGVEREVYVAEIGRNSRAFLRGEDKFLDNGHLETVDVIAQKALKRWVVPRAERDVSYRSWQSANLLDSILVPQRRSSRGLIKAV